MMCPQTFLSCSSRSVKMTVLPGWWQQSGRITLDAVRCRIRRQVCSCCFWFIIKSPKAEAQEEKQKKGLQNMSVYIPFQAFLMLSFCTVEIHLKWKLEREGVLSVLILLRSGEYGNLWLFCLSWVSKWWNVFHFVYGLYPRKKIGLISLLVFPHDFSFHNLKYSLSSKLFYTVAMNLQIY